MWRRSRHCNGVPSFHNLRRAVVVLQTLCRKRSAVAVLKRLKTEARDLTCVAKERDKLREETRKLREELERTETLLQGSEHHHPQFLLECFNLDNARPNTMDELYELVEQKIMHQSTSFTMTKQQYRHRIDPETRRQCRGGRGWHVHPCTHDDRPERTQRR